MAELKYQFRPLTWTGPPTPAADRRQATFKATYPDTLGLLFREAEKLGARELVLQVDISERWIRTDGLPAANARYGSNPGVIVSFDSAYGPLRYATDTFTGWRDNLRAIALSLEALRAVDRYGVSTRGEQYTGWRALPAGNGTSCPFGPPAHTPGVTCGSADEAARWMRNKLAASGVSGDFADLRPVHRALAKQLHPDTGGTADDWDRLDAARQLLTAAGLL